jgi:hypothetical protein
MKTSQTEVIKLSISRPNTGKYIKWFVLEGIPSVYIARKGFARFRELP